MLENIRICKVRIPDTKQHLSAPNGYRLILCCNKNKNHVVLFNVYPKKGPLGRINQSADELVFQLKEYLTLLEIEMLVEMDPETLSVVRR
jgi:hypothetical protein